MRPIRFRLDRLMIWVAVVAVNLAAFRVFFATRNVLYLVDGMLACVMIQVGISRAIRNRRGNRPYWLGFTAGGSIASLSMMSMFYVPSSASGSIWKPYFAVVKILMDRSEPWIARLFGNGGADEIAELLLIVGAWFLPLWLAAMAGGHLGRLLFARSHPPVATT